MPLSRVVNNIGVGKVEATFNNVSTTIAAQDAVALTEAGFNLNRTAVSFVGLNQVAVCSTTAPVHGCVLGYSEDVYSGKTFPSSLVVQISGIAHMHGTTTLPVATMPANAQICCRSGKVAYDANHGTTMVTRGQKAVILNVFNTDHLEVRL